MVVAVAVVVVEVVVVVLVEVVLVAVVAVEGAEVVVFQWRCSSSSRRSSSSSSVVVVVFVVVVVVEEDEYSREIKTCRMPGGRDMQHASDSGRPAEHHVETPGHGTATAR